MRLQCGFLAATLVACLCLFGACASDDGGVTGPDPNPTPGPDPTTLSFFMDGGYLVGEITNSDDGNGNSRCFIGTVPINGSDPQWSGTNDPEDWHSDWGNIFDPPSGMKWFNVDCDGLVIEGGYPADNPNPQFGRIIQVTVPGAAQAIDAFIRIKS